MSLYSKGLSQVRDRNQPTRFSRYRPGAIYGGEDESQPTSSVTSSLGVAVAVVFGAVVIGAIIGTVVGAKYGAAATATLAGMRWRGR